MVNKTPYKNGLKMVQDGIISQNQLDEMIKRGDVAGPREVESYRLKGVTENITASFPSPSVTLPKGLTLNSLDPNNTDRVKTYKQTLADKLRPVYEAHRDEFCEKVMVRQS